MTCLMKRKNKSIFSVYFIAFTCFLLAGTSFMSAQSRQDRNIQQEVKGLLAKAASHIEADNFSAAEASFRKAISLDPSNDIARYNFGNLYLKNEKNRDAFNRLMQASKKTADRELRHKSFHNKGNLFMEEERYAEAVEAYKNALRNNPTDDETRYNLALAKKKLEDEGGSGGDGDDDQQQPDDGGGGEDQDENEDQQDQPEDGNQEPEENNEGEGEDDPNNEDGDQEKEQETPQEGEGQNPEEEGDQQQPPPQPMEGRLSPEQIQNLLEAIENQEKDVQDKVNKQELKGEKVRSEKDW